MRLFGARSKGREKATSLARLSGLSRSVDELLLSVQKDIDGLRKRLNEARAVGAFLDQDEDCSRRDSRLAKIEQEMKFAESGLKNLEREKKFLEMLEATVQHEIVQIRSR